MPSFEIPDGPTTVPLKTEAGFLKGTAEFTVNNKTGEGLTGRFSVDVQAPGKAEWYTIQGEPERPVPVGNQTVTVVAKIPAAAPPGDHTIKLRATNLADTDNDSTESAARKVTIPAAKPVDNKAKKPFPWWILAVIGAVLVVVIGVIIAVVVLNSGKPVPTVTGLDYPAAVAELKKSGFNAAPVINEVTTEHPLGLVFKQDPAAAKKADPKKVQVKLTVAIGETAAVPVVTDKLYVAAQALLEDRGFTVAPRVVGQATGKQPDTVLTQDPVGEASAPKGSPVTLTVDPGVVMPDLLNPQLDGISGIKALQAAGLDIGNIGSACRGAVDKIIEQSVDAKTKLAKGTKVDITIGAPSVIVNGRPSCRVWFSPDVMIYMDQSRVGSASRLGGARTIQGLQRQ